MNPIVSLTCLLLSLSSIAGANIPKSGNGELYLSYNYYNTNKNFDANSDKFTYTNNGEFTKHELSYFLVHSIRSDWAIIANGSVLSNLEYSDDFNSISSTGIGDNAIGLRKILKRDQSSVHSLQSTISFPIYSGNESPKIGTHQSDLDIRYLYDRYQLYDIDFISIETAYVLRLGKPVNQFNFDFAIGERFYNFLLILNSYYVKSLKSDGLSGGLVNPVDSEDWDQFKIGPSIAFPLTNKYTIQFGHHMEVWGRNIGNGATTFLSLWVKY